MYKDYIIHEDGRIWSCKTSRFLKYGLSKSGYHYVVLRVDGTSKCFDVHRLVALKFCKNPYNYTQVNHIDGNKLNNHYTNLEWCTQSQNMKHSFHIGLHKPLTYWTGKYGKDHNRSMKVDEYDSVGLFVKSYESLSAIAKERNCDVSTIHLAIKNNTKTRNGFYYKLAGHFEIVE